MLNTLEPIEYKGNFIDGEFVKPARGDLNFSNQSPANLKETVFEFSSKNSHVDEACEAAQRAFVEWSGLTIEKRMEILNSVKDVIASKEKEFAQTIARETGKPLWESTTEAKALVGKFHNPIC